MTDRLRIDKWLWQARFFKTRGLAAKAATSGRCRLNGSHVTKASTVLRAGDVLTFPQARAVRVIRIEALGTRRGPAPEAQALYTDLAPPEPQPRDPATPIPEAGGRPTKRARRRLDQTRDQALE
ncbi:RNA-binding S4 domain-containing protein [Litorisediminicola beolgyonensis]|uniref:RNA-binding S4 domain-containing protein n=1 Tax=Litorisediminicola beolgyonensis TaxID=1173614 RepID=A0ABW3ZKQ0_9RHOB